MLKLLFKSLTIAATLATGISPLTAQAATSLPMDRVYQGPIRLPDFAGRDRQYSMFKTRISSEMRTGPNFAGHYAIVEIGCGTGCRMVYIGDVATGQVFNFPLGGEEYNVLDLRYQVKQNFVTAYWQSGEDCMRQSMDWNGSRFVTSVARERIGTRDECNK